METKKIKLYGKTIGIGDGPFGMLIDEQSAPGGNNYVDLTNDDQNIGYFLETESQRIDRDRFKEELEYQVRVCENGIRHFSSFRIQRGKLPFVMHGFGSFRDDVGDHRKKIQGLENTKKLLETILTKVYTPKRTEKTKGHSSKSAK